MADEKGSLSDVQAAPFIAPLFVAAQMSTTDQLRVPWVSTQGRLRADPFSFPIFRTCRLYIQQCQATNKIFPPPFSAAA